MNNSRDWVKCIGAEFIDRLIRIYNIIAFQHTVSFLYNKASNIQTFYPKRQFFEFLSVYYYPIHVAMIPSAIYPTYLQVNRHKRFHDHIWPHC